MDATMDQTHDAAHTDAHAQPASTGLLHVVATLPGLGLELNVLLDEEPAEFEEFLREAHRVDRAFKRWEYVRGVKGEAGLGANVVGVLPPSLPYTGFEGYWAGSTQSPEEIVQSEARLGVAILRAIAGAVGAQASFAAGLDVLLNPQVHALYQTAIGKNYHLDSLRTLEPIFGGLLARLRAIAEEAGGSDRYALFHAQVEAAVESVLASVYIDPVQQQTLPELARQGKTIVGNAIEEHYDIPRAPITTHVTNTVNLRGRDRDGYRLMSEIGRLGHPLTRALLHIAKGYPDAPLSSTPEGVS
jgi:hypothetical protein